jgi:hypothetical protein
MENITDLIDEENNPNRYPILDLNKVKDLPLPEN